MLRELHHIAHKNIKPSTAVAPLVSTLLPRFFAAVERHKSMVTINHNVSHSLLR